MHITSIYLSSINKNPLIGRIWWWWLWITESFRWHLKRLIVKRSMVHLVAIVLCVIWLVRGCPGNRWRCWWRSCICRSGWKVTRGVRCNQTIRGCTRRIWGSITSIGGATFSLPDTRSSHHNYDDNHCHNYTCHCSRT